MAIHFAVKNIRTSQNVYIGGTKIIPNQIAVINSDNPNTQQDLQNNWGSVIPISGFGVRATRSAAQNNIPNGGSTFTAINFTGTDDYDTEVLQIDGSTKASFHETVTNPSWITAPLNGLFQIQANWAWDYNVTNADVGIRIVEIRLTTAANPGTPVVIARDQRSAANLAPRDGAGILTAFHIHDASPSATPPHDTITQDQALVTQSEIAGSLSVTRKLASGDYVEVLVWQNSGGQQNIVQGQYSPFFTVHWLGTGDNG